MASEAVPAGEKLVSLFEPHADIIVKGSRDGDYGSTRRSVWAMICAISG